MHVMSQNFQISELVYPVRLGNPFFGRDLSDARIDWLEAILEELSCMIIP